MTVPPAPYRLPYRFARRLLACAVRHWPKETRYWGMALAAEIDQTASIQEALRWSWGGIMLFARLVVAGFWTWLKLPKEVRMSKRKLVVSLAVGLALVAAGWWTAKIFSPPPTSSTQMIAYVVVPQTEGRPVIALRGLSTPFGDQIKGPVPVSMPAPLLAKKSKVKGNVETLLEVDASGSVAGVREIYSSSVGDPEAAKSLLHTAETWKFKPAMEKGEPVPATVIVQVRF
jgi:TonB family protein